MKYCYLLVISLFSFHGLFAQNNFGNLDYEQPTPYNQISPWIRSNYSKPSHSVTIDSSTAHNGKYSLRLICTDTSKGVSSGTVVYNNIPLDVIGKKLHVSAWAKQSNPDDSAGLISCIVSTDRGEAHSVVKGGVVVHAKEWTLYSREFDLDTLNLPLHHLRLNLFASTKDTLWVDDWKIEVDGKDVFNMSSLSSKKIENPESLSEEQADHLRILCYTWGFLKYFHTQIAAGKFNMDMQLFNMIPRVKNTNGNEAFSKLLLGWIDSLGEVPVCKDCFMELPDSMITYNIDLKWMKDPMLSPSLQNKLQYILANRHKGSGYYARYQRLKNLDFLNENEYSNWRSINDPNELFRLLSLFRYWNIIQYFYPYKNIIGKDWNDILKKFIPLFDEDKGYMNYHFLMTELVNSINDSHSGFYDFFVKKELSPLFLPVKTSVIGDAAVVTEFLGDSLAKANGFQVGDAIEKINDRTIREIINERGKWTNGSNETVRNAYMSSLGYLTGGKDSAVQLLIRRNNKRFIISSKRYPVVGLAKKDTIQWKSLPGNIGYVSMGNLINKNIDSMFRELKDTRALIIDLRHYPNSTVYEMCKYLYSEKRVFAKDLYPNLDYPGAFIWKGDIFYGPDPGSAHFHYPGKIIILVNENSQSQAEWTAMAFQAVPGAITIGSQTSGTDGNVSDISLPGNYHTNMTGLGVFYPDGSPAQRTGVKINIVVKPTIKGIRKGKDEVLEKAITLLQK